MKRNINPESVAMAEQMISIVGTVKNQPVSVIKSKLREPQVQYARSLSVYCIMTNITMQREVVAGMLNYNGKNGAYYCYNKIKGLVKTDPLVKEDINLINQQFSRLTA